MKKRTFILLELLIALAVLTCSAIPLLTRPIQAYRLEMAALEETERERLADLTFSEVKELLIKGEIPWDKLPSLQQASEPFRLEPTWIHVPERQPKKIERQIHLFCKGEKKQAEGGSVRLIYVKVELFPFLAKKKKVYSYRVVVQKT